MKDYDKRAQGQKHLRRNRFYIFLLTLAIIGVGALVIFKYTEVSNPLPRRTESSSSESKSEKNHKNHAKKSEKANHSSSSTSSNSSSSSSSAADTAAAEQALKGKTLAEAIAWAQAHGKSYTYQSTGSLSDNNIVTSVTDNGSSLNIIVAPANGSATSSSSASSAPSSSSSSSAKVSSFNDLR
ncbi:hypothetical protein [Eupransor demetentiae]|uniref:Uncharacterized protein n=1 Tax=Eupransor demetentiae TaxID=3109584 RepID=A0ABM9N3V5_9LACO|nr:hypothetical protein R54876_GBNLAHCA_00393 [Lactobacillaceae bacterium LMG 33000]